MFHDRSFLGRCFQDFFLPVLEYCSAVRCSAADTHLKLLDRAVSGARFLTGCVFECDIAHRRSVAVLCILYKTRCNPMHPLNGTLPGPCTACGLHAVPWLHIGILFCCLVAEPRSTAGLLFLSHCPSGTILLTPHSLVWDWRFLKVEPIFFYWPKLLYHNYSLQLFFPLFFCSIYFGIVGLGSSD